MEFILASQSPRRRELLTLFGLPFTVKAAHIDETQQSGEAPVAYVERMCQKKARAVANDHPEAIVLAADTIVVDGDTVLDKPRNTSEARAALLRLRGRTHHVMTAVTLLRGSQLYMERTVSPVTMRAYTDAEVEAYIATGDPFDKAGGYAIQHEGFSPAYQFNHCFANVMGLPLCHVARLFAKAGIPNDAQIPARCQAHLDYACEVYPQFVPGY